MAYNLGKMKKNLIAMAAMAAIFTIASCSKEAATPETECVNGHAYVELAGCKWATENVGKCSVPASAGPDRKGNGWGFYFYMQSLDYALSAAQSWGMEGNQKWTLPSYDNWEALMNKCYWEWTESYNYSTSPYNGESGCIVYQARSEDDKGKLNKENSGYTPASDIHIFLPATGIHDHSSDSEIYSQGSIGYYWSSNSKEFLRIYDSHRNTYANDPNHGMAVRPVLVTMK